MDLLIAINIDGWGGGRGIGAAIDRGGY